jgi:hypothetical protein
MDINSLTHVLSAGVLGRTKHPIGIKSSYQERNIYINSQLAMTEGYGTATLALKSYYLVQYLRDS